MFREYPPAIQILITIATGIAIIAGGFAVALALLPVLYDYRIDHGRLEIFVLRFITIASFSVARFTDVQVVKTEDLRIFARNPFRTLRLGNRIRRQRVLVERRGIISNLILTPGDASRFVAQIRESCA
ncbi:MAG TPA: hypothetical protein VHU87_15595 [Rhizomicrobium sp.]|jgi:hypothetical protein|nr:hypothetical protein [Rhizomicrobium sp.]